MKVLYPEFKTLRCTQVHGNIQLSSRLCLHLTYFSSWAYPRGNLYAQHACTNQLSKDRCGHRHAHTGARSQRQWSGGGIGALRLASMGPHMRRPGRGFPCAGVRDVASTWAEMTSANGPCYSGRRGPNRATGNGRNLCAAGGVHRITSSEQQPRSPARPWSSECGARSE